MVGLSFTGLQAYWSGPVCEPTAISTALDCTLLGWYFNQLDRACPLILMTEVFIVPHRFLQDSWGFLHNPRTEYWLMCQPIFSVLWGYIPEDWRQSWGLSDRTSPGIDVYEVSHMTNKHVLGYIMWHDTSTCTCLFIIHDTSHFSFQPSPPPSLTTTTTQQLTPPLTTTMLTMLTTMTDVDNGDGNGDGTRLISTGEGHVPAPAAMVCDIMHLGISDTV